MPHPPYGQASQGVADPYSRGTSSGSVLKPTPHVSGLSYDSVEIFLFGHPVLPSTPLVGISRCASTPRRHTVEVSASQGPQQASRLLFNALSSVRPINVHVQSVHPTVCAGQAVTLLSFFGHPVLPVHPKWSGRY